MLIGEREEHIEFEDWPMAKKTKLCPVWRRRQLVAISKAQALLTKTPFAVSPMAETAEPRDERMGVEEEVHFLRNGSCS